MIFIFLNKKMKFIEILNIYKYKIDIFYIYINLFKLEKMLCNYIYIGKNLN